jgi:hypothetical protein
VANQVWRDALSVDWQGAAADALRSATHADMMTTSAAADQLHAAAKVARSGASDLYAARSRVRYAVEDIRSAGFDVGEDLSVTDRASGGSPVQRAARQAQAQTFAGDIRQRAAQLVGLDQQVAAKVTSAMAGIRTTFPPNPAPDTPPKDNRVHAVDHHWKQDPTPPSQPPSPGVRGLPPDGVRPPVSGNLTPGPASRPSERALGGQSLWDDKGGEWRFDPGSKYHNPHWDYNPHNTKFSEWQNIAIGDLPSVKGQPPAEPPPAGRPPVAGEAAPPARPEPAPPPAVPPVKPAPVEPPAPRPAPPRIGIGGGGTIGGGGGGAPGLGHGPLHEPAEE